MKSGPSTRQKAKFTSAPFMSSNHTTRDRLRMLTAAVYNGVHPSCLSLTLPGLASTHCLNHHDKTHYLPCHGCTLNPPACVMCVWTSGVGVRCLRAGGLFLCFVFGGPPPLAWRAPRDYASVVHVRIVRGVQMSGFYKGEKATAVAASLPYSLQKSPSKDKDKDKDINRRT